MAESWWFLDATDGSGSDWRPLGEYRSKKQANREMDYMVGVNKGAKTRLMYRVVAGTRGQVNNRREERGNAISAMFRRDMESLMEKLGWAD